MEESEGVRGTLSRRTFLKGSVAALGLAAVAGSGCTQPTADGSAAAVAGEEKITQGVCRGNCGGGCRMNVHVRNGKVVKTSVINAEDPLDTRICARGLSHASRMYSAQRIQYPMRRVDGTPRGAGQWERVTWDAAIDEIATKWKAHIEEFGPSAVSYSYCAGTYGLNQYVYMRLFNCFGGTSWAQDDDMAALELSNRTVGNFAAPYLAGNDPQDVKNAKNIFFWASNATLSCTMRWVYILEARKRGAKLITIDPIYNDIASKSDMWVPIRPGTDGALAMAMTKIIVDSGKAAEDYLRKNTVAPFLVKASDGRFLRMSDFGVPPVATGKYDMYGRPVMDDPFVVMGADGTHGKLGDISSPVVKGSYTIGNIQVSTAYQLLLERIDEWTPEKASEVCDIPVETIHQLADIFADGPSHLNLGFGNDHWGNGASITHAQFVLSMVAGQWGIPGGATGGSQGGSASCPPPEVSYVTAMYGRNAVFTGGFHCIVDLPEAMEAGKLGDIPTPVKSIFLYACNLMASGANRNALMKAFDKMELIVTADSIMTDTTRYSDIILPVPHWFEFETASNTPTAYMDFNEAAIPPQFESKEDVEIAKLIGLAMGYEDMNLTNAEFHQLFFETPIAKSSGVSFAWLKEKKHWQASPIPYIMGNVDLGNPFPTKTGRAEFYIEDPAPRYNHGQELDKAKVALPHFRLPDEAWPETVADYPANPLADKYPMILISHRDRFKVHTNMAITPWLLEIQPEPTVEINPSDSTARGIAEGDYVRVFNDRGSVVLKAHIDPSMRPGMMWTEHTWLQEQYVEGHYATLTSLVSEPHFPTQHHFDNLVEVEKTERR
ncbi:MAG: molybdopterin-dependent oxidoreductase [Coriobacteriia bacterium]